MGSRRSDDTTYGIWGLISVFVLISIVGLGMFLVIGSPNGETSQVQVKQTLAVPPTTPESNREPSTSEPDPETTTTARTPTTTTTPAVSVTLPGGDPAPEGVVDVLASDGAITYSFDPPDSLRRGQLRTAIAPTTAVQTADGKGLVLRISCGLSSDEFLAQTSVTETDTSITVMAVVLAPTDAPPCVPGAPAREVPVPLSAPAAGRPLIVVPAGTNVPGISGG